MRKSNSLQKYLITQIVTDTVARNAVSIFGRWGKVTLCDNCSEAKGFVSSSTQLATWRKILVTSLLEHSGPWKSKIRQHESFKVYSVRILSRV